MTTAEADLYPRLSRQDADLAIAELLNGAHHCQEYDPTRAVLLTDLARRLERHKFAVRPLIYRPAPVQVVMEPEAVTTIVREWDGPTPGAA